MPFRGLTHNLISLWPVTRERIFAAKEFSGVNKKSKVQEQLLGNLWGPPRGRVGQLLPIRGWPRCVELARPSTQDLFLFFAGRHLCRNKQRGYERQASNCGCICCCCCCCCCCCPLCWCCCPCLCLLCSCACMILLKLPYRHYYVVNSCRAFCFHAGKRISLCLNHGVVLNEVNTMIMLNCRKRCHYCCWQICRFVIQWQSPTDESSVGDPVWRIVGWRTCLTIHRFVKLIYVRLIGVLSRSFDFGEFEI